MEDRPSSSPRSDGASSRKGRWIPIVLGVLILSGIAGALIYLHNVNPPLPTPLTQNFTPPSPLPTPTPAGTPTDSPANAVTPTPGISPNAALTPAATGTAAPVDLGVNANSLSNATVVIKTDKGDIHFKFYSQDAPQTSKRIAELIQTGFYNGLVFHRAEPGFVIQGGDPTGRGSGGSGTKIKAEFNKRRHVEGTVGMARGSDPDSADSQFYICLSAQPDLDGKYTVLGQVVQGMDIARKITKGDKMLSVSVQ